MQRRILDAEDRKSLNRWRLAVIGVYGTIIAALLVVASLNAASNSRTPEAQMAPVTAEIPANGPRQVATQR
jgi:hypothetical protein